MLLIVFAAEVTLRGLTYRPVNQQPIILGKPNQLLALSSTSEGVHKFRLPAFQDDLIVIDVIFGVLGCARTRAIRFGPDNLHSAIGEGVVERRVVAFIA